MQGHRICNFFFLPHLAELSVLCRWFAFEGMLYVRQGSGSNVPHYLPAHLLVTQIRLLGCHSTRSHRAKMVCSSTETPGSLAMLLLTESLEIMAFYFNLKNAKVFKMALTFPVDLHVARNRSTD